MAAGTTVKIFVGNLSVDTSQEELAAIFEPYGTVVSCSVLRQFAFVHLAGLEGAKRAIQQLNGCEFKGRNLVVEESRGRPVNSTKVFVGNLTALCTAQDLKELFQTFGKVLECDKVKGYAFVHMEKKEDALQAIETLHGTTFKGRPLSVELSKVQPSKRAPTGKIPCVNCGKHGHYAGDCPLSQTQSALEQYQSQVAAAAAAGVQLQSHFQVQHPVHNSLYAASIANQVYDASFGSLGSSVYASAYGADGNPVNAAAVYGSMANSMYGSVANPAVYGSVGNSVYGSMADSVYSSVANAAAAYSAMANQAYTTVANQVYASTVSNQAYPSVSNAVYATVGNPVYGTVSGTVGDAAAAAAAAAAATNSVYGATVANQVYGSVVGSSLYSSMANSAYGAIGSAMSVGDPTTQAVLEAARAQYYSQKQPSVSDHRTTADSTSLLQREERRPPSPASPYGARDRSPVHRSAHTPPDPNPKGFLYQRARASASSPFSTEEERRSDSDPISRFYSEYSLPPTHSSSRSPPDARARGSRRSPPPRPYESLQDPSSSSSSSSSSRRRPDFLRRRSPEPRSDIRRLTPGGLF
ncbi:RNA-binding protein 14b [Erpetoichthys calabaricus]|uniref:RNA-binding protein 14 n=1 Tax=Erpetoichthys calabaricus TaxID=27687 RepID=A0A8C4RJG3_ERPCA|nr:RNA-binding protein 14b [Erpetoichthys calabaricus]XP_028659083.1 RNA-binding protein 14b [Erpetoichthys calabaricus]